MGVYGSTSRYWPNGEEREQIWALVTQGNVSEERSPEGLIQLPFVPHLFM